MNNDAKKLIDRLAREHSLSKEDYAFLVRAQDEETAAYAGALAAGVRREVYGTDVYIRGLIEIGNICRNDCLYCGIRRSNTRADRYRLTEDEIFECACEGYTLGFRTFVMQGGEDGTFGVDSICRTVRRIKRKFPDCAVTLSLGEFPRPCLPPAQTAICCGMRQQTGRTMKSCIRRKCRSKTVCAACAT